MPAISFNKYVYNNFQVKLRSVFPELEHAELKYFWENKKKNDFILLEDPRKLTLEELKGVMREMASLTYDFNVKSVPRSTKNDPKYPSLIQQAKKAKNDAKNAMDDDWAPELNGHSKQPKRPRLDSMGSSLDDSFG